MATTSGYIKDIILSEKDLQEAKELAKSFEFYDIFQMYNLFHLQRADISEEERNLGFYKTLLKYSRKEECTGLYFLRYIEGSFTRFHHDQTASMTIVTLLDDKDLVGGQSIVKSRYKERPRPSKVCCVRHKHEQENPPYGMEIAPDVIPIETGESLVYGPDLSHGVAKVYGGERLVLIAWFNDKGESEE